MPANIPFAQDLRQVATDQNSRVATNQRIPDPERVARSTDGHAERAFHERGIPESHRVAEEIDQRGSNNHMDERFLGPHESKGFREGGNVARGFARDTVEATAFRFPNGEANHEREDEPWDRHCNERGSPAVPLREKAASGVTVPGTYGGAQGEYG